MTNIADLMLNKRIDLYAEYERALNPDNDWYPPHRRALEERGAHLRVLCLRGLARCYPTWTDEKREQMLAYQAMVR